MTRDENTRQDKTEHDKIEIGDPLWLKNHGLNFSILPKDVSISTMTALCRIATPSKNTVVFNVENIGRYFELEDNKIVTVKYGYAKETNRSLEPLKNKSTEQSVGKNFFNQVTIVAKASNKKNINFISVVCIASLVFYSQKVN